VRKRAGEGAVGRMPRRAGIGGLGAGSGVAGLQAAQAARATARDAGEHLQEQTRKQMTDKCSVFKDKLEQFARKHKNEIIKNPDFRSKFNTMCSSVGVDPLASNKGFWGALGMGDFYYELGVQLVQVCIEQRSRTGGIESADDVLAHLKEKRGSKAQPITIDDLERAVRNMKGLGKGLEILSVGGRKMIQSVPCELSRDHTALLEDAKATAFTSVKLLNERLGWPEQRAQAAIDFLVAEGIAWVDSQGGEEQGTLIWFPAFFPPKDSRIAP